MRFSERSLKYRVARGVKVGLAVSTAISIWAALAFALKSPRQADFIGIKIPELIGAYLIGGVFGGAFVGAMVNLMRWSLGAFILGFIANLPTALIVANFVAWDASVAGRVSIGLICACLGGVVALYIRSDPWPT